MYECLVGYTPFYADDPVMTCRKILRWQQVRMGGVLSTAVVSGIIAGFPRIFPESELRR